MRRYNCLSQSDVYEASNRLRDVFLAARDGHDVDKITDGLLTRDEKLKIGRRILIAEYLLAGLPMEQIVNELKVGMNTVMHIGRRLEKHRDCFDMIEKRRSIVEKEYDNKKYRSVGSSQLVFKRKEYTGFKRKDVERK